MPIYEFKCPICKKKTEYIMSLSELENQTQVWHCSNKNCSCCLSKEDQQINFAGEINMNSSAVGVAKRKYSNKAGGPKPIIDNKIRHDLNMPRG